MGIKYPEEYCEQKGEDGGLYNVPFQGLILTVIVSHGGGWDHVSVSLVDRCPTWDEMSYIKELFFEEGDCVIQYHVPRNNHVNIFDTCLHLWRPHDVEVPMPPTEYV